MHALNLLGQKEKRSHGDAVKLRSIPTRLHDSADGVGIRPEQEMSHFVRHDAAENRG